LSVGGDLGGGIAQKLFIYNVDAKHLYKINTSNNSHYKTLTKGTEKRCGLLNI